MHKLRDVEIHDRLFQTAEPPRRRSADPPRIFYNGRAFSPEESSETSNTYLLSRKPPPLSIILSLAKTKTTCIHLSVPLSLCPSSFFTAHLPLPLSSSPSKSSILLYLPSKSPTYLNLALRPLSLSLSLSLSLFFLCFFKPLSLSS